MRAWSWILLSVLAGGGLFALRATTRGFDAILVSGPRDGAFFSCGCGTDRRGGMTLASARAPGRVLWVEVGDPYGEEREFVRRFLVERTAGFRVEGEGAAVEEIRFTDGRSALLVFVDRIPTDELALLARRGGPLLCVGSAFREEVHRALYGAKGIYVAGDRLRRGGSDPAVLGMEGAGGRQIAIVGSDLSGRVVDVEPAAERREDELDLAYLEERHRRGGVLVAGRGLADPGVLDDPDRCASCHAATVERWRASRHARALRDLGAGAGRTCYGCHSVLRERPPTQDGESAVTCASCHGDTRGHPEDGRRLPAASCVSCHTLVSSPRFERESYGARVRCGEPP
ncbi:MAG: multiheme c-type cytochrome [Planctomycetota bacterium]